MMASNIPTSEISHDFPGFFKVHEDGRIERYWHWDCVPPGFDSETGVESKDVVISEESGVKARIFLPKDAGRKLPLLVHYHGGGFCLGSALSSILVPFFSTLVTRANVIVLAIEYRLAPENKLPVAYEDSLAGLQWIAKHIDGLGPEQCINEYADLERVILAGESSGATLAHYVAVQAGATELAGVKISKLLIVHPFFGNNNPDQFYIYMDPTSSGTDNDPKLHPRSDPNIAKLKCDRVLVCVAENDELRSRAVSYYETMKTKWGGDIELYETLGEDHAFHFLNPKSENIVPFTTKMIDFIKLDY